MKKTVVWFIDQYVEMINSRDISIVEFPKLKNIDLYLLKYYAKLIYVDI